MARGITTVSRDLEELELFCVQRPRGLVSSLTLRSRVVLGAVSRDLEDLELFCVFLSFSGRL
jgi:hypothetical protein